MRRVTYLIVLTILGSGVIGGVRAQSSGVDEVPVRQPANLSPAEKLEAARVVVIRATALSERVTNLHSVALREADMIRITCLSDKLAQINANLRNAEGRLTAFSNAVDPVLQDHEFTVISVLGQRFKTLEQEANECVGQDVYETGNSTNSTTINSDEAGSETEAGNAPQPPDPVVVGSVPPPVSPNT